MQPHVDMTNVFSSGPLTKITTNSILRSLEGVCGLISLYACLTNDPHFIAI